MAAFSPMTFPEPELYTAVSSPSPKGPWMGGISPALEKDPRSSHPVPAPPSCLQSLLLPRSGEWLPGPLPTWGFPLRGKSRGRAVGMNMAWCLASQCLGVHPSNPTP